jgi:predicted ester cyclase
MKIAVWIITSLSAFIIIGGCGSEQNGSGDMEQNKDFQRAYIEALNRGDATFVEGYLHPEYVFHGAMGDLDKEQFSQVHSAILAAFPNLKLTIEDQIAEGDKVVMRWTGRGRHEGEFQGLAPTGKEVVFTGITISRIEGGKEVEAWEEVNMLGLMQQIGAIPTPE